MKASSFATVLIALLAVCLTLRSARAAQIPHDCSAQVPWGALPWKGTAFVARRWIPTFARMTAPMRLCHELW